MIQRSTGRSSRTAPRSTSRRRSPALLEALESRTLLTSLPAGIVDVVSRTSISGWAINKDDGQGAVNIEITVNGTKTTVSANAARNDLANALGSPYHAFSFTMPTLPIGISTVLVQAVSTTSGARTTLKNTTLNNPAPIGNVEIASSTRIAGWAYDADSNAPIQIRIDVDGVQGTPFTTTVARPDLDGKLGVSNLGFDVSGSYAGKVVEVFALDAPSGALKLLYTNNRKAVGTIDNASATAISGWAFDADSGSNSINVRVDVDGVTLSTTAASNNRNDLVNALGSPNHGYSVPISSLTPGSHTVKVYAIDGQASSAAPVLLGTRTIVNNAPIGVVDTATSTLVRGWAYDADLGANASTVNVYVDDTLFATVTANRFRYSYPAGVVGANHGFAVDMSSLPAGSHSITVTAVDNRTSDEDEVIIYDDFINNHTPVGSFDKVDGSKVYGWAYDQDAGANAIAVDVYVDGVYATTGNANLARTDIDNALPTPNHAFAVDLPTLSFGSHRIDLYAAESQGNVSVLLGTKTVVNNRPIGILDTADSSTITGWAADRDRPGEALDIKVYINGVLVTPTISTVSRPDIASVAPYNTVPGFTNYGFTITLPSLSSGRNQIDVYAADKNNTLLTPIGSKVITV